MHQQVTMPPRWSPRRRKPRIGRWLLAGLSLLVGAGAFCGGSLRERPVVVTTEPARLRDLTRRVTAVGKIRPEVEVKISPEVAGEIVALPVALGQPVKKGDLLVKVKPDNYVARVRQAEAVLSAAQADSDQREAQLLNDRLDEQRAQELFSKRLLSEADFKAAETKRRVSAAAHKSSLHNVEVSRSSLDQAADLLAKTVIRSPIDGAVSALGSELGERVVATGDFAGTEVMRVANLGAMEARVEVNENDVVSVARGDPVRVRIDAYPGRVFEGRVKQIASTATVKNESTQQEVTDFEVRILLANPGESLRPGMSCGVDIETETVRGAVSVPIEAVTVRSTGGERTPQANGGRETDPEGGPETAAGKRDRKPLQRVVFLNSGGLARQIPVQTGIADDDYIQILSGVNPGDRVIAGPYTAVSETLKDGRGVEIDGSGDDAN